MACSFGSKAKLLMEPGGSTHTFDSSSEIYEFYSSTVGETGRFVGGNAITGSFGVRGERVRQAAGSVGGVITMDASAQYFSTLIPKMIGDDESPAGTFTAAETIPYFGLMIDKVGDIHQYNDCKINQWVLEGRAPQYGTDGEPDLIKFSMQVIGTSEATGASWPGTPPTLPTGAAADPYIFSDGVVTLSGSAREIAYFRVQYMNHLSVRYGNSLTPTSICSKDRTIVVDVLTPWISSYAGLYGQSEAGAAASIALSTNSSAYSTTLTFGRLHVPNRPVEIPGKNELFLHIRGFVSGISGVDQFVIVNDATT